MFRNGHAIVLMAALLMATSAQAKRRAPAELPPIDAPLCQYTHQFEGLKNGHRMHILCIGKETTKPLWDTVIYTVEYDKDMETDVQEIELASFQLKASRILAKDEHGGMYEVNAQNGALIAPTSPKHYASQH